jgi:LysM repeat protein
MVRDYLDWAAEQVGIARLVAYALPLIAAVSLVGGVFAYLSKDSGNGGGGLAVAPTVAATRPAAASPQAPGATLPPQGPTTAPPPATPGPAGTAPAGTPRPAGTPAPGAPGATPTARPGSTYTVVAGDNPTVIANKQNIPAAQQAAWIADLLRINNVTATTIRIGQVLNLPPAPGAAPAPGGTTAPPPATPRP